MRVPVIAVAAFLATAAHAQPPAPSTAAERAFFTHNATTSGVVALPGLQVQVLKSGPVDGPHPKRSDEITVRYRGSFTDGRVFNTSPNDGADPTTFPLQKLIPGWVAALQLMRPGDVWKLYVPAYLAYGARGKETIPPDTTLVFQVELVSISPAPPAPAN